jgi:hypothetical protein
MRTTLTLDDDLGGLLKRRARELGISFKEAVNRTIRAGLGMSGAAGRLPAPKTIPHSFGFKPGIDLDKLGQLADELEAEALADNFDDSPRRKRSRSRPCSPTLPSPASGGGKGGGCTRGLACGGTRVWRVPKASD